MRPAGTDDAYLCVPCDSITDSPQCRHCAHPTVAVTAELAQVRQSIQVHHGEVARLQQQLSTAQGQLDQLQARHRQLLADARRAAARTVPAQPAPQPTPPPAQPPPPPPAQAPARQHPAPPPPEKSARSVQQLLLWMGAILSGAAIIAFTAVAWATFGLPGRAGILTVITAATMVVPLWMRKRGLTSTAEALAGLAMLMVACDAVAVYFLDVLPSVDTVIGEAASGGTATLATALFGAGLYSPTALALSVVVVGAALLYGRAARLVVPGYVAAALAAGVTVLACAQSDLLWGVAALLITATMLGAAAAMSARYATTRAQRGLVHTSAAVAAGFVEVTALYASGDYTLLTVTAVTAGLLTAMRVLPHEWRRGPLVVSGAVWAGATMVVTLVFGYTIVVSLAASSPIWNAAATAPRLTGFAGWEVALAVVFTVGGIATVLPRRPRIALLAAGASATVMTLPAALALPFSYAAPLVTFFAVLWAAVAVRQRGRIAGAGLGSAGALAAYAFGLSLGGEATTLLTLAIIASTATTLACLMWMSRRSRMAGFLTAMAAPACYGTILVALHWRAVPTGHITVWALVLPAALLVIGALRHCHWYTRATDARWPMFNLPAAAGLAAPVAIGGVLALEAASSPQTAASEKLTLAVATFAAGFSGILVLLAIIEPQASRVRAAAAGATVALITALAAYGTWWHHDALLWYTVATIVVGLAALTLPRRLSSPVRGTNLMLATIATALAIAAISAGFVVLTGGPPVLWLNAQTPTLSLAVAAAGVILLPHLVRWPFALSLAALAAVAAPVVWPLAWWTGPALTVGVATVAALWAVFARAGVHSGYYGVLALLAGAYSLAAALRTPLDDASDTWLFGAVVATALLLTAAVTAVLDYRRRTIVGGAAVCGGLALLTLATALGALGWELSSLQLALAAMGAASLGLLIAFVMRVAAPRYLPWASVTVPVTATAAALTSVDSGYVSVFFAVSGLIGVAGAMLTLPHRKAVAIRSGLAVTGALPAFVMALPAPLTAYLAPHSWLTTVWTGDPVTTLDGLGPAGASMAAADPARLAALALTCTTMVVAALGLTSRATALLTTAGAVAIVLPAAPLPLDLPWPTLPLVTAAIAVTCYLLVMRVNLTAGQLTAGGMTAAPAAAAALSGALATSTTTIIITGVYSAATVVAAILAITPARRATSWALAGASSTGAALAAGVASGLAVSLAAFGVLTIAALFFALRTSRSRVIDGAAGSVEITGHAIAMFGLLLAVVSPWRLAIALVVYGSLLGLLALLATRDKLLAGPRVYAAVATIAAFLAYWLLLNSANVSVMELYTVPFALATVVAGWLELRRRPAMRSWLAYGAGLCLGFLPSLALVLISPDEPWRRLVLGAAAVIVLALGGWRRLQAPVVITAILLPLLAIREIAALWTYVPSWLPLAVAGVLLLTFGATFEKRRRDLRRLRESVAAMR